MRPGATKVANTYSRACQLAHTTHLLGAAARAACLAAVTFAAGWPVLAAAARCEGSDWVTFWGCCGGGEGGGGLGLGGGGLGGGGRPVEYQSR